MLRKPNANHKMFPAEQKKCDVKHIQQQQTAKAASIKADKS